MRAAHALDSVNFYLFRGLVMKQRGRADARPQLDSAYAILQGVTGPVVYGPALQAAYAMIYAGQGRVDEARQSIARSRERLLGEPTNISAAGALLNVAMAQVIIGDHDAAVASLELLLERPSGVTPPYLRLSPEFAPLRSHPRWAQLVR